jgi:hypothetical protein
MEFKKLLLVTVFLFFAGSTFAQLPTAQSTDGLPFYFPTGIFHTTDPIKQREEVMHALQATWVCSQGSGSGIRFKLNAEPDSMVEQTDIPSTSSVTDPNAKMKIVLDHYLVLPDGRIRVTSLCNQQIITKEQGRIVIADLKKTVIEAATIDHNFYNVIYDKAIAARADKLGISVQDLVAQLDEKVPGYDVTFRELHHLPKPMKLSDFVPRELHLGYNPPLGGILGVTWLNTGIIYYNPEARMLDFVSGVPAVMGHEMVHGNVNIEKFPMAEAFDAEFMACLPMMILPDNITDMPDHGYLQELRELDEVYFNFDFPKMEKDIFKYDLEGNTVYDVPKYLYYYQQLQTLKKENLDFFQNVSIPEFYSDPIWWGAVNDIRGDNNSVFRMTMALHYNPTSLGGSQKTMEWLDTHKEEITAIAKKAMAAGLNKKPGAIYDDLDIPPQMIAEYHQIFSEAERTRIESYFKQNPEKLAELRKMPPTEALEFLGTFKTNAGVPVQ